jgi:hypothetical protein
MQMNSLEALVAAFKRHAQYLVYAHLSPEGDYLGWVSDFGYELPKGYRVKLNLKEEFDLFGLFVLALGWSRSGPWENSTLLVSYLKWKKLLRPGIWSIHLVDSLKENIDQIVEEIESTLHGIKPRKKISIRHDIFNSIVVLDHNWAGIIRRINSPNFNAEEFGRFLRSIRGLGCGSKRMLIKIPLILRELRCQGVQADKIPGELCCVPDARVLEAASSYGLSLPKPIDLESVFAASSIIYRAFGNLYDLPLFSSQDIPSNSQVEPSSQAACVTIKIDINAAKHVSKGRFESSYLNDLYNPKKVGEEEHAALSNCPQIEGKPCCRNSCHWYWIIEQLDRQPREYYSLARNKKHMITKVTAEGFFFDNLGPQYPALRNFAFCFSAFLTKELEPLTIGNNISGLEADTLDTELGLAIAQCDSLPSLEEKEYLGVSFKRIGSIGPELCGKNQASNPQNMPLNGAITGYRTVRRRGALVWTQAQYEKGEGHGDILKSLIYISNVRLGLCTTFLAL